MCCFSIRMVAGFGLALGLCAAAPADAGYTSFESSHVHPITLTPSGDRLLAVNTPDALLEVFAVQADARERRSSPCLRRMRSRSTTCRT